MFFFKKYEKKEPNSEELRQELKIVEENETEKSLSTPVVNYVHTASNREPVKDKRNDIIVLYWISEKKNGYDLKSNKYPKWFKDQYNIEFNDVVNDYIKKGFLSSDGALVTVTLDGEEQIKKNSYVIYVYENPQYCLTLDDFANADSLGKVKNEDIAWGVFNYRIITYQNKMMWSSLSANYANMADLLIHEKKYENALDFIFSSCFLQTSGMTDYNKLLAFNTEYVDGKTKDKYLSNGNPDIFCLEVNNYYVTVPFLVIQKELKLDWDDIHTRFVTSRYVKMLEQSIPFAYFGIEESYAIFKEAIEVGDKKGVFPVSKISVSLKYNVPDKQSKNYFYDSIENRMKNLKK